MNFSKIRYLSCSSYLYYISKTHSKIFSYGFVHAYFSVLQFVVDQSDHKGLFSLLALNKDSIAFENFELRHFGLAELDRRIFIIKGLLHLNQPISTSNLLGAFFWSRIAVDTSFLGSIFNEYNDQK